MKKCLFLLTMFISLHSMAQKFYFPKQYYADSVALDSNIATLARQVIASYKETDRMAYFDNLVRFQIVAKWYEESNRSLDSLRPVFPNVDSLSRPGIGFQFQTFSLAKLRQTEKHVSFSEAYEDIFESLYKDLPYRSQTVVSAYFPFNLNDAHDRVNAFLDKQSGKDSISLADARALCRSYNSYHVYSRITATAQNTISKVDASLYNVQDSVMIPVRDGSKVAALVVRSKKSGQAQPTILMSNIYYSSYQMSTAKEIVYRGFTAVILSTRGKYISEAAIEPFEHDANDAYDVIDWISKQPWCNGKVGMYGGSYLGFSQWAAVKHLHPALKTIVPQVAVAPGIDYPLQSGVFMSYMLRWIHYVCNSPLTDNKDFSNEDKWHSTFVNWYKSGKSFRSLDTIEGRPNNIFQRWLQHPSYDNYWKSMTPQKHEFAKINIPILTITGYFDDDQRGAFYYFNQHNEYNKHANHFLLIGPWNHYGAQSHGYSTGGYTIDSVANISIDDIVFQWFNHVLKDGARPAILKNKINYEVMGTNVWKHTSSLNKVTNDTLRFYLSKTPADSKYYLLQNKKPTTKTSIEQKINFLDRSDSLDMNDIRNSDDYPILDSVLNTRNYLSFISAPLEEAIEVSGSFSGGIVASINKKDVDINVQLYELQQDGKYFQLSSYLTRASYTKDAGKRQLLQPFKEEKIAINNSYFVSKKLDKGSKIIVLVGVNKNRDWQLNYGTGKDVSDETIDDAKVPLAIKWYNTSSIKIPVHRSTGPN